MSPKTLLFDIETSPLITYSWGLYEADAIKLIAETQILCFAYKWLGERRTHVLGQDDFKDYKGENNDKNVVSELHKLFSEADTVIAHNGASFDVKVANARFMAHRLGPAAPFKQIDTKRIVKRYARFPSSSLNNLGKSLELGQKLSHGGFGIWEGCMRGNKKSWKIMKRYNKQDVILLEQLYLELRPWIENHPAMGLMDGQPDACPKCGDGPLIKNGFYYTKVSVIQVYKCLNCGGFPAPGQLRNYQRLIMSTKDKLLKILDNPNDQVLAIDMDGVICEGEFWGEGEPAPIPAMIERVWKWYKQGAHIIIYTARHPRFYPATHAWLIKHEVPFHGIAMQMKPGADCYICDKALNPEDI